MTAPATADLLLKHVFLKFGLPSDIVSDKGSQFEADFFRHICDRLRIKQLRSTAFHPETDGQTERVNQTLKTYLRAFVNHQQSDWPELIKIAEFAINNSRHSSTGQVPLEALMGYLPRFDINGPSPTCRTSPEANDRLSKLRELRTELISEWGEAQRRMKHHADRLRSPAHEFSPGDLVWWRRRYAKTDRPSDSLDFKFLGPFKVTKRIGRNVYRLKFPPSIRVHNSINVRDLKPHTPNDFPKRMQPPPEPVVIGDNVEHEVERILDTKLFRGNVKYLVRWKGFGPESDTWQSPRDVINAPDLCAEFHNQYPNKPRPPPRANKPKEG
jgi:hypothetical protein